MRKLTGAFFVLTVSRIVGMIREVVIALAFGFSRITDLFYQATWPLTALMTISNGPFTTAFAARLASAPSGQRVAHARYYFRATLVLAVCLAGLFLLGAIGAWAWGFVELSIILTLLAGAAFSLTVTGFFYALATAHGWVALAAILLFVGNFGFVAGIVMIWFTGIALTAWLLPALFSLTALSGLPLCRMIWRKVVAAYAAEEAGPSFSPLPGFAGACLFAGMETGVFLLTQGLIVVLATWSGEGWVSAVALVQRVVFSVNGLLISPFASLLMLSVIDSGRTNAGAAYRSFKRGFSFAAFGLVSVALTAGIVIPVGAQAFGLMAMLPNPESLGKAIWLLPAFSLWLLPMGLNVIICRTMFGLHMDRVYTLTTISGYFIANIVRLGIFFLGGFGWAIASGALIELAVALWLGTRIRAQLNRGGMAE